MTRRAHLAAIVVVAALATVTREADAVAAPGAPGASGTFTRGADAPPTSAGATSAPSIPPPRDEQPIVPGDPAAKADQGAPAPETPRREVPVYNNRGTRATAGDVALGTLRVIVSPIYFLTEYVIRRPIGAGVSALERSSVPKTLYDFFLFGPDHKAGVVPTFLADFGLRPSVGLYGFWNDAFVPRHDMIVHGSTWGSDWLAGGFTDRYVFRKGSTDNESTSINVVDRPDHPFYGIGPRSTQKAEVRYGSTRIDLAESVDQHLGPNVAVHGQVGARWLDFQDGKSLGNDRTLAEAVQTGALPAPPGFRDDYTVLTTATKVTLDSRNARSPSGSGVRFEAGEEMDFDLRADTHASWIKYGGALTGFLDLDGRHRVLSLSVATLYVDPLEHGVTIPFTELASLGGLEPMRAYLAGRMIDRSFLVGTLEYRWPVWNALDGTLKAELGNVFDAHLGDFKPSLLRFSGSVGVETAGASDNPLQIIFGAGSETFEHGGQIDSFRLFIGTTTNGL
jgi:hypothetical protein